MFGLVVSNNLLYMYTFWEITSVCSFLLIGYTESRVAVNNSFKALWMNLLGRAAFAAAIIIMGLTYHSTALSHLVGLALAGMPVTVILALLLLCGFTKSAMMPFSGWLLGAMVAPTPTSALLHSSTMVKAGVFLIIKLCPALEIIMRERWRCLSAALPSFCVLCRYFTVRWEKGSCLFHNFQFGTDRLLCGYRFL